MNYAEKLKNPKWQKKRLEVLGRDKWQCQKCFSDQHTLHVHHKSYQFGKDPWEYDLDLLITLCEFCHEEEGGYRKSLEKRLLEALRGRYWTHDLLPLIEAFESPPMACHPEVISTIIKFILTNEALYYFNEYLYWHHRGINHCHHIMDLMNYLLDEAHKLHKENNKDVVNESNTSRDNSG